MDSSAPKRRKTSPTTNVPIGGTTALSSKDEPVKRPIRRPIPSFASPTKASLARSNPEVLERSSTSRPRPSDDAPVASEAESLLGDAPGNSDIGKTGDDTEASGRDTQHTQSTSENQPWSPVRRATGAMTAKPRRTPNKPSPRPLPEPSVEEEEELINPFKGRVLRRSPPPGEAVPEEPELPPTPTQQGISNPASIQTSPMGIHNTPTKRPRRSKVLAERIKSSPLKQPPLRHLEFTKEATREESPSRTAERTLRAQPQSRKKRRKSHPARNAEEPDPLAEKKSLRDSLLAEVARLRSDLELATRENTRLHELQQGRKVSSAPKDEGDKQTLFDLFRRHALPPEKETPPDPTQDWLEAALNPISFLPFSKAKPLLPSIFSPPQDNTQQEAEKLPISHHPVPMTAQEEMPFLQVFTPLTFTSTVSIIPRDDAANQGPLLQKYTISASSTVPGVFAATIEMVVNTKRLSIAELKVARLEPSAVGELGPFVERVVKGTGTSALTRNISVITWAMGEWLRVATRRARFWCAIERDLKSSEGLAKCVREMRTDTRRKGRGRQATTARDDEDDNEELEGQADKMRFTKANIFPHLGRTDLDLELPILDDPDGAPTIRIKWRIEFDWTGEARSKIGLLLETPAKWHGQDKKRSLTNIPGVFDKLIQENKDPMEALKTVIALLVGE
ncbi:uncharacterized protein F4812DRAFT_450793 [Daldinia caldariorum]|uniref:uncharacterized protein n=1 Tax=Daldinia caldariorum TaxID=326644 RepID=UPI00200893D3|nr:uncharacterized protein F4812DRAFT_450793 [Daldinia caldariorum]KAI1468980.1 hypothetical protein F4812DRAFT_450793 [Daldinia caldariorum]